MLRDAFPDWPTAERAMTPPRIAGTPFMELARHMHSRHADWPASGIEGMLANFRVRDDDTVEPWLTLPRHMAIARRLWEHDPVALYPRLAVPALLLLAEQAGGEPARHRAVETIESAAPSVAVEWFRPGDHDLHAQFPDRVAAAIARLGEGTAA
jgi:pimeloyl-ACP methyl ester carboxylesterase